jgi:DNA gyrase subunit A
MRGMAKQLDVIQVGQIIPTALHTEMQQSYLEYAMSVIIGRALPDVRDGLKPVHRRIIYAMHELGLVPDRPFRKSARVVGDVLGKYHPHGDQSVYDALVRLVQDFSSRYPVLAGHGNFGSIDADPPAAMRYTETKLAPIGHQALLSEIGEAMVDFTANFDNSQQEPVVLPAQLPFLLLNGSSGIAVGMATNIPPHNLGEVVDGLIAIIDKPEISDEDLNRLIPGPDFPTGGEIHGTDGIWEAYTSGRGSIQVRGVSHLEEIVLGKGRHRRNAIVITELPYQVNKASLIERIAEFVNAGKIEGIADLRDESDRDGIRVVIELRRDGQAEAVLERLYKLTPLQNTFGVIFLAISNNQPKQFTLRQMIQEFLDFRIETLTRRYRYELDQAESRSHIVEGWIAALDNIDRVITILRASPDGTTAKLQFQDEFDFSDRQADAILAMPLRRLTGLERKNLEAEFNELAGKIAVLKNLLGDRKELLKALKKELRALKKQYGDPRRTKIIPGPNAVKRRKAPVVRPEEPILTLEAEIAPDSSIDKPKKAKSEAVKPETAKVEAGPIKFAPMAEIIARTSKNPTKALMLMADEADGLPMVLEFTAEGQVRRMSPETYDLEERDLGEVAIVQTEATAVGQTLLILMASGRLFPLPVKSIPLIAYEPDGVEILSLLPNGAAGETVLSSFFLPESLDDHFLILLTAQGRIKRLPMEELTEVSARGLSLIKIREEGDRLAFSALADGGDQLVIATSTGRLLRLEANDQILPSTNRAAPGILALRVLKIEHLVGLAVTGTVDPVLLVSEEGYAKRVTTQAIKLSQPGELGTHMFQFTNRTDTVVGMTTAFPEDVVTLITSDGQLYELCVDDVPLGAKEHKGEQIVDLGEDEKIIELILPIVTV